MRDEGQYHLRQRMGGTKKPPADAGGTDSPSSLKELERETGFEPATSTLARSHSTTELLPHFQRCSILMIQVAMSRQCISSPTVRPPC